MPKDLLDWALYYAARGISVFPCNDAKRPLTEHGFQDATTDPDKIRAWWDAAPLALIGCPTGVGNGIAVLDIDTDPATGIDGTDALEALERQHGKLPETVEALTPRGGTHKYFKHPGDVELRNSAGKLGRGLDFRGDGGYIILPPSRTARGAYEWEGSNPPHAAPLPQWLADLCKNPNRWAGAEQPKKSNGERRLAAGERNSGLASVAGILRRGGASAEALRAALLAENARLCDPPLSTEEVERIAASVSRYEPADPFDPLGTTDYTADWRGPAPREDFLPFTVPELVEGMVPMDAGALIASGGTGKTTVALWLALHVALGRPFCGFQTQQGRVLVVSAEDSSEALRGRIRALCDALGLSEEERRTKIVPNILVEDISASNVRLVTTERGATVRSPHTDALVELYREQDIRLCILDPLGLVAGTDENDNAAGGQVLRACRFIARGLGAAVLAIHHTGKNAARMAVADQYTGRGASAIADNSRFVLQLMPVTATQITIGDADHYLPAELADAFVSSEQAITALVAHKHSYARRLKQPIFLCRDGWQITSHAPAGDAEALEIRARLGEIQRIADTDVVRRFLLLERDADRFHSRRSLDGAGDRIGMPRAKLRGLVESMLELGELVETDIPAGHRKGQRKTCLLPP